MMITTTLLTSTLTDISSEPERLERLEWDACLELDWEEHFWGGSDPWDILSVEECQAIRLGFYVGRKERLSDNRWDELDRIDEVNRWG